MKKINKKKILILIILIILIIIEIKAFTSSKASNVLEITANIVDNSGLLGDETCQMQAVNEKENGMAITLPNIIVQKKVESYVIDVKQISDDGSKQEEIETNNTNTVNKIDTKNTTETVNITNTTNAVNEKNNVNTNKNENIANTTNTTNTKQTEKLTQSKQEKKPGEKIYLSKEEIKNKKISLKVKYETKEKTGQTLYNKVIDQEIESHKITLTGFMPNNAKIKVEKADAEKVEETIKPHMKEKTNLEVAYDIKIMLGEKEYEPKDIDETIKVTISGLQKDENKKYRVIHIDNQNKTEEVQNVEKIENIVTFKANEFSTYALLSEDSTETDIQADSVDDGIEAYAIGDTIADNADIWDGTVATEFALGEGTQEKPYLITKASELAYLAQEVNNGNSYEGKVFQLTKDINLNQREWTPIGNASNSFKGIFNGSGRIIENATITISGALTSNSIYSYGFFGSIGNGSTYSIVKNTCFKNITINFEISGNTTTATQTRCGYSMGIVTGTMYNKAKISNVSVKNSSITAQNSLMIRSRMFQFFTGGIAGNAQNYNGNYNDPGDGNRYSIENCYASVDIDTSNVVGYSRKNGWRTNYYYYTLALTQAGGIIGNITKQPVWPENCLYSGNIDGNAFIGPIFGGLIKTDTTSDNVNYFSAYWNGNQAGGNLSTTSHYTNFKVNGQSFSNTIESGTSRYYVSSTISNSDLSGIKGVNKGIYTNDISTLEDSFNNGTSDVVWLYENGDLSLVPRLTSTVTQTGIDEYQVQVDDRYQIGNYTYEWYINGTLKESSKSNTYKNIPSFVEDQNIVMIVNDGNYYSKQEFSVKKLEIHIEFNIDKTTNSVEANLAGTAIDYISLSDYTFKWYKENIAGDVEELEGENSLSLGNLEEGYDYKLVATNNKIEQLSAENSFTYGDRIVIFVDPNNGNNNYDGYTPETAVRSMTTAYSKVPSTGSVNTNIIVLMGAYTSQDVYYDTKDSTNSTYQKKVTVTGKYKQYDYSDSASLYMYYSSSFDWWQGGYVYSYNFINEDTTFQYLTFNGNGSQAYLYAQGYNLTMGKGIHMQNYSRANTNQGLITGTAPAFHVLGGYLQYNRTTLPRNNGKIVIKSGAYGRVLGGGGSGNSSGSGQTTSHDFTGSNLTDDIYTATIDVDIQESTKGNYEYDINLLVGGATAGNMYANIGINVKNGSIGRLLGGSIGDRTYIRNWNYPENTFLGYATINLTGGTIQELYGGSLGRNMDALGGSGSAANLTCDIYFYGTININISGNTVVNNNIYGAGAGGVTGYSENSTDEYKSYGKDIKSNVNINISGGTINGNIYGGGYGYTEYLTEKVTATDGGALYGDSNVIISGGTINGNIYGAGCGYNYSNKNKVAQLEGTSTIQVIGTPTITGQIFGAGQGVSGYEDMAKLTGNSNISIEADLSTDVYGGGNISKTVGKTNVNIKTGTHTGDIYGGGNVGIVDGDATTNINGGTQTRVFGGGNQAKVTNSIVNINGGTTNEVYAGGNQASVDTTKTYLKGGTATTIYGGSNQTGTVTNSYIETTSGNTETIYGGNNIGGNTEETNILINGANIISAVYGGGNQVSTTTTNVNVQKADNIIPNVFGGGNQAGVTTSNVTTNGADIENVFGGSNTSGDVNESNVTTNDKSDSSGSDTVNIIQRVYGGNNQGGTTKTTNVTINGGGVTDVYGGGNQAVTNLTNVNINGKVTKRVFGGGNQAGIETNTNVNLVGADVGDNVYGGGDEGTVTGNTYVHVKNSTLNNSLYAGGNGSTAIVYGNTNLVMDGTTNNVKNSVFGGGNKAATGEESKKTSKSTVNIVGATIGKNVYGGANTSVVYGTTQTNLGYDTVNDSSLEIGNIEIGGTVFGGGEANESGSENYDFSFISVTNGIDIQINGNGHTKFQIAGSIFGSGNASSTSGESYINIQNYGTPDEPKSNVSIQRANCATISNSSISLSGTTDRTNEYSTTFFSLSRVDQVKLKNNSILYLCNGANLLKNLDSLVDNNGTEEKAVVTINPDTGEVTNQNVDNRIYMLEGKNLNIATNEQVTAYGQVHGMLFFGLFTNRNNPSTSTGFYHHDYKNGDTITNEGTFSSNSYAMAQHMANHDISVDGFYTNYKNEGKVKVNYIDTTPKDDVYYIWLVGEKMDVTRFEMSLTASKYATLGTYELLLQGFSDPNIKFSLTGFSAGLANGISLVDPGEIETIAPDADTANSVYGLSMKTGNTGWKNKGNTIFLTKNGGTYTGTNDYDADNSTFTPTLNFCFYHSENITVAQALGDVTIRLQVLTPIDDLNYKLSYIDIAITLSSALYQNDFYEAAITPGQEFGLFTTTETTITSKSAFSAYYSLYIEKFSESKYYSDYKTYQRVLVSRDSNNLPYVFQENTKLTMLDMVTNKYYYYIVTAQDVAENKYIYNISDFVSMGSNDSKFNEQEACNNYYNTDQDLIYENFIFHVNFSDSTLEKNIQNNSLLMELRDSENQTLIGVLGIQRGTMVYTVYNDKEATIKVDGTVEPTTIYLGNSANLNVTTTFTQTVVNSKTVYDTQYFDKKLGIKISIYDNNGNKLNNDSLLGINFELDNKLYYPRIDGTTRISIADKVTDVLAKIKINTKGNTTLATGDYKIKIESFGSSDGIYYGLTASDVVELDLRIINLQYGLKVTTADTSKIIEKDTGKGQNGSNSIVSIVEYSSALSDPNIAVSLYRRNYDEVFDQTYTLVDFKDYTSDRLTATKREKEYVVSESPLDETTDFYTLKTNLQTGTYKLVYKLYDGDTYVGEAYDYIVIK